MLNLWDKKNIVPLFCSAECIMGDAGERWNREVTLRSFIISTKFASETIIRQAQTCIQRLRDLTVECEHLMFQLFASKGT